VAKWILVRRGIGPFRYPDLGFFAKAGDVYDGDSAPDAHWVATDAGHPETVDHYRVVGPLPDPYSQPYSTTSRTHAAYVADAESVAYTGSLVDSEAKLADLNALRVAYENLRVAYESTSKVLNQVIDDLQALGLLQ